MDMKQAQSRNSREENTLKWIKLGRVNPGNPGVISIRKAKRGWTYTIKELQDGRLVRIKWGTCKTIERARSQGERMRESLMV